MIYTTIGWLAAFFLAICGVPQAYFSWRKKHSRGVSWGLLICWFLGEFLMLLYILPMWNFPLLITSVINIGAVSIILYYKVRDRYYEEMDIGEILARLPKHTALSPYFYGDSDIDATNENPQDNPPDVVS